MRINLSNCPPLGDERSSGPIKCNICNRIVAGRYGFITHHNKCHANQRPQWEYSGRLPDNPRNLPYQLDMERKGTKICKLCGHFIGSISGVYKHFKTHHPKTKPDGNYKIVAIIVIDNKTISIKGLHND